MNTDFNCDIYCSVIIIFINKSYLNQSIIIIN